MAYMIDSITVTRDNVYKGAGRLLYKPSGYTFPAKFEDIMVPTSPQTGVAYTLASGWVDLGPTNEDGVVISRTVDVSDGIVLDQRMTNLDEGEPEKWGMSAEATLMETTLDNLKIAWEGGTKTTLALQAGTRKAQHSLSLDASSTFTERIVAFVQEDTVSGGLRALAFRKAIPKVDGELAIKRTDASGIKLTFTLKEDTTISEGSGEFGMIFEIDP